MTQLPSFISGFEVANLVVNSDLLKHSWTAIENHHIEINLYQDPSLPLSVSHKFHKQSNCTIISFVSSPICTEEHLRGRERGGGELVSSEDLKAENFPVFDFLCSEGNPSFSISRYAVNLFKDHFSELCELKKKIHDSGTSRLLLDTPLIIAGHSLGGSVASLFTLWLLDNINQIPQNKNQETPKLPLCITFGAPLLGDKGLQGAILERWKWNSCFLHVAGNNDPFPRLLVSDSNHQAMASTSDVIQYKPFGTFLLCSDLGSTCVEDPEVVLKLLKSTESHVGKGELQIDYYRNLVESLKSRFLIRGNSQLGLSVHSPIKSGLLLQLEASGVEISQQQHRNNDIGILIRDLEEHERKRMLDQRKAMDPNKKLNEIKKKMAYLEWYKKECKAKSNGYYDSYKNQLSKKDMDVTRYKKTLTTYWKKMVEDAERMAQKERARIRKTWLYAGTNYRRMVEPLDIAEYYRENGDQGDYLTQKRSKHYILLEKWQMEESDRPAGTPNKIKKENVGNLLTEDSCFWARVEKAVFSCELLKHENSTTSIIEKELSIGYLNSFEEYVMDQINNYAVSPEIFLKDSRFMKWWKQYFEEIIEKTSQVSPLVQFMKNGGPEQYKEGGFSTQDGTQFLVDSLVRL